MLGLWLCFTAVIAAAGSRQPARPEEPPEAGLAMQDLSDAMQIKPQFNAFLNRVNADADKLHNALEAEGTKVADLELEKQSLQGEMRNEKQRLTHELEVFKQKMIAKITDLKTTNRRLEATNMQLVSSNDKLSQELEVEKSKKGELIKKLKKMQTMFIRQQQNMQQIIQSNSMKLEGEVANDVKDAMSAVDADSTAAAIHQTLPRAAPVESADVDDSDVEDEVDRITATEDGSMSAPRRQSSAAPAQQVKPAVRAPAMQPPAVQAPKAAPVAPVKVPLPAAVAPKPVSRTSADDEQLKALRNEVDNLEKSVKTDDEADSAGPASSMLHVAKRTVIKSVTPKVVQSNSVETLQQVGGMLSAAMASGDDDDA